MSLHIGIIKKKYFQISRNENMIRYRFEGPGYTVLNRLLTSLYQCFQRKGKIVSRKLRIFRDHFASFSHFEILICFAKKGEKKCKNFAKKNNALGCKDIEIRKFEKEKIHHLFCITRIQKISYSTARMHPRNVLELQSTLKGKNMLFYFFFSKDDINERILITLYQGSNLISLNCT